ncbi:MAG: hypothetical protein O2780_20960 [Proteobacteria bacterium]|nr:hypothetical protein [Pseudomonadota bacterium]
MFEGGGAPATVIEVELSEENSVLVGCYQAVKYRTLAALERDLPEHAIKAYVAARNIDHETVRAFCKRNGVQLVEVSNI